MLICPVCGATLARADKTFTCPNGHGFDIAHEGYVNLLLGRSRGDTREMLLARRRFLERGYYTVLAEGIGTLVADYTADKTANVLDVGCGEGYYLGHIRERITRQRPSNAACYIGVDIAKEAVRLAARTYRDMQFIVADAQKSIPIATGTVNALLDIFAPRSPSEFARILLPGGLLLVAIPSSSHLAELRSRLPLLSIEAHKERHVVEQLTAAEFEPVERQAVRDELRLDADAIADLVMMTPNYWHLPAGWQAQARALAPMSATFDVTLLAFRRR